MELSTSCVIVLGLLGLLYLNTCNAACGPPIWQPRPGQHSVNSKIASAVNTEQECKDICLVLTQCVAAEVFSFNGNLLCHTLTGSSNLQQLISAPGYTLYQLIDRCSDTTHAYATCVVYGDPHYKTFDFHTYYYDYMGINKYNLVSVCNNSSVPQFQVLARNNYRPTPTVSYIMYVEVVYGSTVRMAYGNVVTVNGAVVTLPYSTSKYSLQLVGGNMVYKMVPGYMVINYDGVYTATISLSSIYFGSVCGMCGNFDGNPSNDLQYYSSGLPCSSSTAFGDSNIVYDPEQPTVLPGNNSPTCTSQPTTTMTTQCGMIVDTAGVFSACIARSGLQAATTCRDACLLDACWTGGTSLGSSLRMHAEMSMHNFPGCLDCQTFMNAMNTAGIAIATAACSTGFTMQCRGCVSTCDDPFAHLHCTQMTRIMCACPVGQLLYNGACIDPKNCPTAGYKRTVVMIYKQTVPGEDIFLRGGIEHSYRLGCTTDASTSICALSMSHNQLGTTVPAYAKYNAWRAGNSKVSWYGAQANQGSYNGIPAQGSAMVWTSNNATSASYQLLNTYGEHYWMIDMQMNCAETVDGWFEFKAYDRDQNGNLAWEPNIAQDTYCTGTAGGTKPTYTTSNHFARCGFVSVFSYTAPTCLINTF